MGLFLQNCLYLNKYFFLENLIMYLINAKILQVLVLNRYVNYLICIFININEDIRNKKKNVNNLRGCINNMTHISAAYDHILSYLIPD